MSRMQRTLAREREVRQQRILLLVLTIAIMLFSTLIGSGILAAGKSNASNTPKSFKYYTSIEIQPGDTLWSIAEEYISPEYGSLQDYIDEIKELNQLEPDEIHSGRYLMIPYYSSEFQ